MAKLNDKEEKMALHLADGKNQTEAFISAGYKIDKMKRSTIHQKASKVANRPRVQERVRELRQEIASKRTSQIAWDKDRASKVLSWLITMAQKDIEKRGLRQSNANAIIASVKELNELEGVKALDSVRIDKTRVEIANLKGIDIEIEDMAEIEGLIYGEG